MRGRRARGGGGGGRAAGRWRGPGAGGWGGALGVGVLGPEGASWEGRRFGTGPSFVRMTDGAGSSGVAGDWGGGVGGGERGAGEGRGAASGDAGGPVAGGRALRSRRGFVGGPSLRDRSFLRQD